MWKESNSDLASPFETFASRPVFEKLRCDKDPSCAQFKIENFKPVEVDVKRYLRFESITVADLESAKHSCEGAKCRAKIKKKININEKKFSTDLGRVLDTELELTYYEARDEDHKLSFRRLSLDGEIQRVKIGEFGTLKLEAALVMDLEGSILSASREKIKFSYEIDADLKFPYLNFEVALNTEGMTVRAAMGPEFTKRFPSLKLPVLTKRHFISYRSIRENFKRAANRQNFDPASNEYWDQFAERLAVLDGY